MNKGRFQKFSRSFLVNATLALIVLCWLVPVLGIFVSSFRQRFDIQTSPWWHVLPHKGWVSTKTLIQTGPSNWRPNSVSRKL